jgi:TIR domain
MRASGGVPIVPGQPAAFMSYARFNDQHDDGKLTQFRERLSAEVQVQTGEEFPIFQDRSDIAWGQNWQERIDQALNAVTLLLVIITPGFFRSHACRAEVERFLERERDLGRDDLILPVYYVSTPELEDPARREADKLARVLASRQYADWRELRFKSFNSPVVRRAIAQLATRMRDTFWRLPTDKPAGRGELGGSVAPRVESRGSVAPPVERGRPVTSAKAQVQTEQPNQTVTSYHPEDFTRINSVIGERVSKGREAPDRSVLSVPGRTTSRERFKALLLIGASGGGSAKVARIAYYISLAWAVPWAITGVAETVAHFSVGYLFYAIFIVLIVSLLMPWGLYKLATRLNRRA